MKGYLDIHSHVLPGVDDGSENMEMSLRMLEQAYGEGTRFLVATPHYYPGHRNAEPERILEQFESLKDKAEQKFPDLKLMLGNEIYYKDEAVELVAERQIFTLDNSRYVLVEFNIGTHYKNIYQAVKCFTLQGYYPILAHMERYAALFGQEAKVRELIGAGAYLQVNTETILGGRFDRYKKYCMKLFSQGLIHFLGSDCHNTDTRKPIMETALRVLEKKTDPEILDTVLEKNPERFLNKEFL